MPSIEIPLPEFGFDEIAKEKARFIASQIFHTNALFQYFTGSNPGLEERVKISVLQLDGEYERLICIVEVLNFLTVEEDKLKDNNSFTAKDPALIATGFNKIRYLLYSLAKKEANYTFDKNSFSTEEVADINSKVDEIIYALSELKAGQEVLFDQFEEVKSNISSEFESLKSLPALGKKTFYQLIFGKIASFTGDKIADEILKAIAPHIIALLATQAPHLVEELQKLLK